MYKKYSSAFLSVKWTLGRNTVVCSVVISFHSLLSAELKALEGTTSVGLSLGTGKPRCLTGFVPGR